MRAFACGEPFMEVRAEDEDLPVFSEAYLYDRVGKENARFILAVADEYARLIQEYGTGQVREWLAETVTPEDQR